MATAFADVPPLVYSVENTGVSFPESPYTTLQNAADVLPLPDPFMWSEVNPWQWMDVNVYPAGTNGPVYLTDHLQKYVFIKSSSIFAEKTIYV
jgi:hypothetical protein